MIVALLILVYIAIGYSVVCFACWWDAEEIQDECEAWFMTFVVFGWFLLLLVSMFLGVVSIFQDGNFHKIIFWLPNLLARWARDKNIVKVVK